MELGAQIGEQGILKSTFLVCPILNIYFFVAQLLALKGHSQAESGV